MDKKIQSFIDSEKNLTLCTCIENIPHCANCFYVLIQEYNFLVIKSGRNTQHISNALINERIAGTIVPDIQKTGTIKGVQFSGRFFVPENEFLEKAKSTYYSRYPFALIMPGELWGIELLSVKMTDNTLGFGKKIMWEKSSDVSAQSNAIEEGVVEENMKPNK